MMMSELPLDLLGEILSRIPATTLSRLRPTCKRWNALVKDQKFTEKHLRKAPKQFQVLVLKEDRVSLMNVNCDSHVAGSPIEFKGALGLKDSHCNLEEVDIGEVMHCDGLLLCTTKTNRLVVWNPCLGETRWVQPKTNSYSRFFLGYEKNKSCHSYKILRCWEFSDKYRLKRTFEIYVFSTDSWRVLDDMALDRDIPYSNTVSLKGNAFWLASANKIQNTFILSFDFTTERFKRFCVPQFQNPASVTALSVVREEKLSLLYYAWEKLEVWVTNKNDTEAALSWSKSFTVDFKNWTFTPLFESFLIDEEKKVVLCCYFNFSYRMYMVCTCGGEDDEYCKETLMLSCPFIFNYVPSLVHIQQDGDKRTES